MTDPAMHESGQAPAPKPPAAAPARPAAPPAAPPAPPIAPPAAPFAPEPPHAAPLPIRYVEDVETMRVLADPLRIAILRTLMTDAEFQPPVMSAKELSAALGEPQTKLYRHLKQLEEVGLIAVAETRLVSGIVEQRYRAGQISIGLSRELVTDPAAQSELLRGVAVAIDDFRDELLAHWAAGRIKVAPDPGDSVGLIIQATAFARMSRDKAADFRRRLNALSEEFRAVEPEPDGVLVRLMIGWYATEGEPNPPG